MGKIKNGKMVKSLTMNLKLISQEKSTAVVDFVLSQLEVASEINHTLEHLSLTTTVKGFRKGKAPLNLVRSQLKEGILETQTLEHVISHAISDAIKELKLKVIANPSLLKSDTPANKDWSFTLSFPLYPEIKLNKYQDEIKAKLAKDAPKDEDAKLKLVFDTIVDGSQCEIPQALIDEEVNRSLGRLISQAEALNLSISDYLKSINRTPEKLREEYQKTAVTSLKLDFLLFAIAKQQDFKIEASEVESLQKTSQVKPEQKPYLESILLKRKAVDYLLKL